MSGYNCAQAVLLAYQEELGLDEKALLRMSSSMGGGMGGLREACGAVSSMFLVLGALVGPDDPTDSAAKKAHYHMLQGLAAQFEEAQGALRCSDLLKGLKDRPGPIPSDRTDEYYKTRPCIRFVSSAARLIDEKLIELSQSE